MWSHKSVLQYQAFSLLAVTTMSLSFPAGKLDSNTWLLLLSLGLLVIIRVELSEVQILMTGLAKFRGTLQALRKCSLIDILLAFA